MPRRQPPGTRSAQTSRHPRHSRPRQLATGSAARQVPATAAITPVAPGMGQAPGAAPGPGTAPTGAVGPAGPAGPKQAAPAVRRQMVEAAPAARRQMVEAAPAARRQMAEAAPPAPREQCWVRNPVARSVNRPATNRPLDPRNHLPGAEPPPAPTREHPLPLTGPRVVPGHRPALVPVTGVRGERQAGVGVTHDRESPIRLEMVVT
jgi:hypothetical protein